MPTSRPPPVSTGLSPAAVARSNAFESVRGSCDVGPTTPTGSKPQRFGLLPVRSPLLRESRLISLRRATEMFQFAHGPPPCLCIQHGVSRHHSGRVAPLGYSGLLARMQLPLNVSPVSASFIGLQRLGIHLVLSLACALLCVSLHFLFALSLPSSPPHSPHPPLALLCFSSLCLPWQN